MTTCSHVGPAISDSTVWLAITGRSPSICLTLRGARWRSLSKTSRLKATSPERGGCGNLVAAARQTRTEHCRLRRAHPLLILFLWSRAATHICCFPLASSTYRYKWVNFEMPNLESILKPEPFFIILCNLYLLRVHLAYLPNYYFRISHSLSYVYACPIQHKSAPRTVSSTVSFDLAWFFYVNQAWSLNTYRSDSLRKTFRFVHRGLMNPPFQAAPYLSTRAMLIVSQSLTKTSNGSLLILMACLVSRDSPISVYIGRVWVSGSTVSSTSLSRTILSGIP